jgi:hypothetical protein
MDASRRSRFPVVHRCAERRQRTGRDNPRQFNAAILPGHVAGLSEKGQSVFLKDTVVGGPKAQMSAAIMLMALTDNGIGAPRGLAPIMSSVT